MKYLAAYLLLQQGGNSNPSASDVSGLLQTVGAQVDESRLKNLLSEVGEKDVNELIETGKGKFASMPSVGAGGAGGAAAPAGGAAEEAKEEKKEEAQEESDEDMGMGLFD